MRAALLSQFPNTRAKAWYCPSTQAITLEDYSIDQIREVAQNLTAARAITPVFFHELQHFHDHIGTTWGQNELVTRFQAFSARLSRETARLGSVNTLYNDIRRCFYSDYYSELYDGCALDWDRKPWRYDRTMGYEIRRQGGIDADYPIPFYRFSTSTGIPVCRVPLTIASLLEVRAVAAEMAIQLIFANTLPRDERVVEVRRWEQQILKTVYDPCLARYSVAAHYFANVLGCKDVLDAYTSASRLAGLALMIPGTDISRMRTPDDLQNVPGMDKMRARGDRVFAFMALVEGLRGATGGDHALEDALRNAGLIDLVGKLDSFPPTVSVDAIEGPPILRNRLLDLISAGRIVSAFKPGDPLQRLPRPLIVGRDGIYYVPEGASRVPPELWHQEGFRMLNSITEIVDASF